MSFFTEVHTTQKFRLGTRAKDSAGNEYIYLKGVASTAAGSWVTYDEAAVTTGVDTDVATSIVGPVAIAMAAVVANDFGWYLIWGKTTTAAAISGGGAADNAKLFATSTVFTVDDVSVAGSQIVGAISRSAESSGVITVQVNYPWIGANVA